MGVLSGIRDSGLRGMKTSIDSCKGSLYDDFQKSEGGYQQMMYDNFRKEGIEKGAVAMKSHRWRVAFTG